MHILICEDADDTRTLFVELLRAHGHDVWEASRGAKALEMLFAGGVDVAFVDIGLPDVDGFEIARRVRSNPTTCEMRLVAVTGYGSASDRASSRAAGFDTHLLKPVKIDEMLAAIADLDDATVREKLRPK